jgi:prepilin-type N-terminal cleavage/methylation domain-containing protein
VNPCSAPIEHKRCPDAGLSLIELIVAVVVSTIVLAGIATVFVNSWLAQSDVLSTSEATNRGQLVSSAVEKAMRNALHFEVFEGAVTQANGSELRVRTTLPGDLECQAFHVADGVAEMKSSNSRVDLAGWGSWLDVTNYDAFVVNVKAPTTGAFRQTPTTGAGTTLTYDFAVRTDSAPVKFTGEVSIRAAEAGTGGCW